MADHQFADLVTIVPPGCAWTAREPCAIGDRLDLGDSMLVHLTNDDGARIVLWFVSHHCPTCGHLIHPDQPDRCLSCGTVVIDK